MLMAATRISAAIRIMTATPKAAVSKCDPVSQYMSVTKKGESDLSIPAFPRDHG